jgi:hypothetical protein
LATLAFAFLVLRVLAVRTTINVDRDALRRAGEALGTTDVAERLASFASVPMPGSLWRRVRELQQNLAAAGPHRGIPPADLLIAAAALEADVELLHYDRDYEAIGAVSAPPALARRARRAVARHPPISGSSLRSRAAALDESDANPASIRIGLILRSPGLGAGQRQCQEVPSRAAGGAGALD